MQTCMWVCWSTVWFCGAYSPVIIGLTSEETILHFNTQAYFGLGDAGIFHPMVWCLVSERFKITSFLANFWSSFSLWDLFHTKFSRVKFVAKICVAVSVPICNSCAVNIVPNSSQFSTFSAVFIVLFWKPFVSFKCLLLVGHSFLHLT